MGTGSFSVSLSLDNTTMYHSTTYNMTLKITPDKYKGRIVIATPNTSDTGPTIRIDVPEPRVNKLGRTPLIIDLKTCCIEKVYKPTNVSVSLSVYGNYGKNNQFQVHSNIVRITIIPIIPQESENLSNIGVPNNLEVLWSLDLSQIPMTQSHHSSPTVHDIDNDGKNEILLGYREWFWGGRGPGENRLLCASDDGDVEWIFPSLQEPQLPGHPMTTPTIIDLDNDKKPEIIFGRRGGAIHCLNGEGEELWRFDANGSLGSVTGEPQIYDNNGDGHPEIYLCSGAKSGEWADYFGQLIALDNHGNLIWEKKIDGYPSWPLLVWDINQDARGEIIACLNNNNVVCFDAFDGREIWRYQIKQDYCEIEGCNTWLDSSPAAADIDLDQRYEILVLGHDGNFYVLSENGELEWRYVTEQGKGPLSFTCPLGDIDDDGNLETCFMDDDLVYFMDLYTFEWVSFLVFGCVCLCHG